MPEQESMGRRSDRLEAVNLTELVCHNSQIVWECPYFDGLRIKLQTVFGD